MKNKITFRPTHMPRKKTNLGESLARSHAYNSIQDCRWDFLARKVSPKVSPRVSARLSARLLARLFSAKSLAESLGSDYMHDSRWDSLRNAFFYAGYSMNSLPLINVFTKFSIGVDQVKSNTHFVYARPGARSPRHFHCVSPTKIIHSYMRISLSKQTLVQRINAFQLNYYKTI